MFKCVSVKRKDRLNKYPIISPQKYKFYDWLKCYDDKRIKSFRLSSESVDILWKVSDCSERL